MYQLGVLSMKLVTDRNYESGSCDEIHTVPGGDSTLQSTVFAHAGAASRAACRPRLGRSAARGFTLIELLIAYARGTATVAQAKTAVTVPVSIYNCPSRRPPIAYPLVTPEKTTFGPFGARTDYAMNGGSGTQVSDYTVKFVAEGVWSLGRR